MTTEEHQAAMNAIALSLMAAIFDLAASAGEAIGLINQRLEASGLRSRLRDDEASAGGGSQ